MRSNIYPLLFSKRIKSTVWGGYRLYGPALHEASQLRESVNRIGEIWNLCEDTRVIVLNGQYQMMTLNEVIKSNPSAFFGQKYFDYYNNISSFPLLFKVIDAWDKLSIQVHPDDKLAKSLENAPFGKTEMWYVLDADEKSEIVFGFSQKTDEKMFKTIIEKNKINDYLNKTHVKKGDVFFIPAGRIHAIGENILIAEIQQNCDITYRVYDYMRPGLDGKLRELHVDKAVKCIDFNDVKPQKITPVTINKDDEESSLLASCNYFTTIRYSSKNKIFKYTNNLPVFSVFMNICDDLILCYKGNELDFEKYSTMLVPAGCKEFELKSKNSGAKIEILNTFLIPNKADNNDYLASIFGPAISEVSF